MSLHFISAINSGVLYRRGFHGFMQWPLFHSLYLQYIDRSHNARESVSWQLDCCTLSLIVSSSISCIVSVVTSYLYFRIVDFLSPSVLPGGYGAIVHESYPFPRYGWLGSCFHGTYGCSSLYKLICMSCSGFPLTIPLDNSVNRHSSISNCYDSNYC